ncbi:MAG TPA: nuclear transport factor 2 family protein [Pseudolabrys sp.]|nr:nuclear transport factor 2 family protein [Pseudolabrys sp.]
MSAETRAAIEDILDAYRHSDNERLAARYHHDVDWLFHAPLSLFPFAGHRRGKPEVFKAFALMYRAFRPVAHEVEVVVVDGDRAATLSHASLEQRTTGRMIRSRIAGFHRFRDGLLVEYRGFTDSFDSVEQVLGRELAL